ncbi:MAG: UDP-3-O-(3-hydroxymyristoyl)glucosamine N-acyltransferase, partial [Rhizobium sp.]|nr:UDP-3-O-(3-hydroxymyristoyl)glucosamine N-acyltransferase [Rhizobium sp.]
MEHNHFFPPREGISLASLAAQIGAELLDESAGEQVIRSVAPVYRARQGDICYILSRRSKEELKTCEASAILCDRALKSLIPDHIPVLLSSSPATAFAHAGGLLYPEALRPVPVSPSLSGVSPAAFVDPTARLEADVLVEPMAVIGAGVRIGRGCTIAAGATIQSALIGNNVIIHNGARIGQ